MSELDKAGKRINELNDYLDKCEAKLAIAVAFLENKVMCTCNLELAPSIDTCELCRTLEKIRGME